MRDALLSEFGERAAHCQGCDRCYCRGRHVHAAPDPGCLHLLHQIHDGLPAACILLESLLTPTPPSNLEELGAAAADVSCEEPAHDDGDAAVIKLYDVLRNVPRCAPPPFDTPTGHQMLVVALVGMGALEPVLKPRPSYARPNPPKLDADAGEGSGKDGGCVPFVRPSHRWLAAFVHGGAMCPVLMPLLGSPAHSGLRAPQASATMRQLDADVVVQRVQKAIASAAVHLQQARDLLREHVRAGGSLTEITLSVGDEALLELGGGGGWGGVSTADSDTLSALVLTEAAELRTKRIESCDDHESAEPAVPDLEQMQAQTPPRAALRDVWRCTTVECNPSTTPPSAHAGTKRAAQGMHQTPGTPSSATAFRRHSMSNAVWIESKRLSFGAAGASCQSACCASSQPTSASPHLGPSSRMPPCGSMCTCLEHEYPPRTAALIVRATDEHSRAAAPAATCMQRYYY